MTKKYNIIYFLDECRGLGGATKTLLYQAFLMKQLGCEICLCYSQGKEMHYVSSEFDLIMKEIDESFIELPYMCFSHTEEIDVSSLYNNSYEIIESFIKNKNPDILHSVQMNVLVELAGRKLNIPHIMNIYPAISAFFNINYLDVYPHYHICDSDYYAKIWKEGLGTTSRCIRTYSEKGKKLISISKNDDYIVRYICVGSIYPEKNQLSVIHAFKLALESGIKGVLEIYGSEESEYALQCREYIKDNGIGNYIKMCGFCNCIQEKYYESDVLICGSTRESYPNVISEALANKLVIITTPVAGVPELIKNHINGYVTTDYSVESIHKKICDFEQDRRNNRLDLIYENMEQTYQLNHSATAVTEQIRDFYNFVICDYEKQKKNFIHIEDLREKLKDIYFDLDSKKEIFSRPDLIYTRLWYIYHIIPIVKEKLKLRKAYIWGAGKLSEAIRQIVEYYFNAQIEGYIDSFAETEINRIIVRPEDILKEDIIVFIGTVKDQHNILDKLEYFGKIYNKDYFLMVRRYW